MVKFILIFFCLLLCDFCHSEMLAITGTVQFNDISYRNTIFNWTVNKSTNFWNIQSSISKKDYVTVGTTTGHYDIEFDFRIRNETEKTNIKNKINDFITDNRIDKMNLRLHFCRNDIQQPCTFKEYIIK